jgi:single-stranded-DNA-specific exonuclease
LELATLATIADMVPREEDNKKILEEGLPLLENPEIISLKILKRNIKKDFVDKAISMLNVTSTKKNANEGYYFLKNEKTDNIKKAIEKLKKDNEKRKNKLEKEEKKISERIKEEDIIVFEEGNFPAFLAGSLGSRIIRKHKKPTFIYVKEGDIASGSARMIVGYDSVKAMKSCKKHLESFGGHPMAAGFVVKIENIENFKQALIKYFQKKLK